MRLCASLKTPALEGKNSTGDNAYIAHRHTL